MADLMEVQLRALNELERLMEQADQLEDPADAMVYLSAIAVPLLVSAYKLTEATTKQELEHVWLERILLGLTELLKKETGKSFRISIARADSESC
jgi:hypothetical protein